MRRLKGLFYSSLIVQLMASGALAQSAHPEVTRTRGFPEYKKQKNVLDKEREKGLQIYNEQVELERREYEQAREEFKKQKRKTKPLEYTPAYQEEQQTRSAQRRKSAEDIEEFRADKKLERRELKQAKINSLEELGLPEDRPRYDLKKRALYGAASQFKKPGALGGSSSSDFGGSSGGGFNPPPPSSFDDFPPPPSFPGDGSDNFDLPPLPPPMPMFDDSQGNAVPFDEFPPPPPPPMPPDDFQF